MNIDELLTENGFSIHYPLSYGAIYLVGTSKWTNPENAVAHALMAPVRFLVAAVATPIFGLIGTIFYLNKYGRYGIYPLHGKHIIPDLLNFVTLGLYSVVEILIVTFKPSLKAPETKCKFVPCSWYFTRGHHLVYSGAF
jgi:hypothetical protein